MLDVWECLAHGLKHKAFTEMLMDVIRIASEVSETRTPYGHQCLTNWANHPQWSSTLICYCCSSKAL